MSIANFYLPTGLTVSGTTILTGSLHSTENIVAQSFTGSISGSSGSFEYLNVNVVSSSNLYLRDPFILIADYIQTDGLEVGTLFNVTGSFSVSGTAHLDQLTINPTGSTNIVSSALSSSGLNVAHAIGLLDAALPTRQQIQSAYESVRIRQTGSMQTGFVQLNLTNLNSKFDTGSFDYITIDVSIKEENSDRWIYGGISKELFISQSSIYLDISANVDKYKLIAVNEKQNIFNILTA